jgi:hypothetical protein
MPKPLFRLGKTIATAAAMKAMNEVGQDPHQLLDRHRAGDWGDVTPEVRRDNELSARSTFTTKRAKVLSTYTLPTGLRIWVLTEADRTVTTLFRPEEYDMIATHVVGPLVHLSTGDNDTADSG